MAAENNIRVAQTLLLQLHIGSRYFKSPRGATQTMRKLQPLQRINKARVVVVHNVSQGSIAVCQRSLLAAKLTISNDQESINYTFTIADEAAQLYQLF